MPLLPYSLVLLLSIHLPQATAIGLGTVPINGACNVLNNGLDPYTRRFVSDCNAMSYCSSPTGAQGTCQPKGCRRDQYPFGYGSNDQPPMCPDGTFCPDEEDQCLPLVALGGSCQLSRDDECAPPPNWRDIASPMNSNGSVCLSFTCQWQNATLGSPCMVENMAYTGYARHGGTLVQIISRDNCMTPGSYCDGVQRVCMAVKSVGGACSGNKECDSYNCEAGMCGQPPGTSRHVATWEYAVTGIGIIILMSSIFIGLFILHKQQRKSRRAEIVAYWTEQTDFRKSLFALHDAHPTLSRPGTMYALAPTSPSLASFADTDTGRGREWTDSKADLASSQVNLTGAGESADVDGREPSRDRKRDWSPLI